MVLDDQLRAILEVESGADTHSASRIAGQLGNAVGLPAQRTASLQLAASEIADNLYRHAQNGVLLFQPLALGQGAQLVALDAGPGMNFKTCLQDGFSTSSTAGVGLGSLQRLADRLRVDSTKAGTILVADFQRESDGCFDVGGLGLPCPGETVNGDNWLCVRLGDDLRVAVIDGVGHGPKAAEAADLAVDVLSDCLTSGTLEHALAVTHEALRRTRGAAISILHLPPTGPASFAGVGNVAGMVVDEVGEYRGLTTLPGTAGLAIRTARAFDVEVPADATVVLHTDGIQARWRTDAALTCTRGSTMVVASRLLRDYRRTSDDATAVAIRRGSQ